MRTLLIVVQIAVALGLLNVWLLRSRQSTAYRGGNSQSMREEFACYGLPAWLMPIVGILKVGAAICLIAGVWLHSLTLPAAVVISVLMVGALAMHLKVKDPWKKSFPALLVLTASGFLCWGYIR